MMTKLYETCATVLVVASVLFSTAALAEKNPKLHQIRKVNAVLFEPGDFGKFLVATYSGIYSISGDGSAQHIAPKAGGLTELIRHPEQPNTLLSSGYRSKTEKLGVMRSQDGGKTWQLLSKGANNPVAFHAMAYSPSKPSLIYATGVGKELHASWDGGLNWEIVGKTPEQVFDITVSRTDPNQVFLATRVGLFKSANGGKTWSSAHPVKRTTTMVNVTAGGSVLAFIYGYGLVTSGSEDTLSWKKSPTNFVDRAIMNIAINPTKPSQMLGVIDTGAVFVSEDHGKSWKSFEGQDYATSERVTAGRNLYEENCAACHGEKGVGEISENGSKVDENGLPLAPAMNDSAHAWHHHDEQLIGTILNGSPRNERMLPWKEHGVTRKDAESLVAYIKSLWNFRSLACQGSRDMSCMH